MTGGIQKAFDELRHAVWMLVLPLIMGVFALFGACQWMIQDMQVEDRLEKIDLSTERIIQEVEESECKQPKPLGDGHICAQATDWWSETDLITDCVGRQCYVPAWWSEYIAVLERWERSYFPIIVPGPLFLVFLFVVIMKITKARTVLMVVLDTQRPEDYSERAGQ